MRSSFEQADPFALHDNVAMLLRIHMLGYPARVGRLGVSSSSLRRASRTSG